MKKFIIYFDPQDKSVQLNQFHVEAKNNAEALQLLKDNGGKTYKPLGIKLYPEKHAETFRNLTFF